MFKKQVYKSSILILAGELNSIDNFILNEYLLNIGNKLAIERILDSISFLKNKKIYIAVSNIDKNFSSLKPFRKFNFINVGKTFGVINSIENALNEIKENNVSIIPITTIPYNKKYEKKICYFSNNSLPKETNINIYLEMMKIHMAFSLILLLEELWEIGSKY